MKIKSSIIILLSLICSYTFASTVLWDHMTIIDHHYLIDNYKGKTINLRIQGINKYLEFLGKENLKLKYITLQQKTFLENIISDADYEFLKKSLWKDNNYNWYFIVRFFTRAFSCATK